MNLLTNGNFEDCDFTGWTLSGYVDDTWCDNSTNEPNYGPHTGSCYCYSGYSITPAPTLISQVVTTTKPGIPYSLSFWYRNQPHGAVNNSLTVKWNGATVLSLVNIDYDTLGYRNAVVTVLGTGNDTLSFEIYNDTTYIDLDDVALTSPEPDAPGNVTTLPDTSKVTISWETAQQASGYTVARGTSNAGPFTTLATLTDLELSYEDTTVANDTTYFYQVCAFNDYGSTCADPVSSTPQNMVVCTKEFHITTKIVNSAYWTFEPNGAGNWPDSANGFILPAVPNLLTGSGRIGHGLRLPSPQVNRQSSTAPTPKLSFYSGSSTGISLWAWIYVDPVASFASSWTFLSFNAGANKFYFDLMAVPFGFGESIIAGMLDGVVVPGILLAAPGSAWNFVTAVWDKDAATFKAYLNGVLIGTQSAAGHPFPNSAFDSFTVDASPFFNTSFGTQVATDEVGFLTSRAITAADITFLYNSGAGVTWPAVQAHFGL